MSESVDRHLHFCYPRYTQDEMDSKDAEIDQLKALLIEHSSNAAELAWFKKDAIKLIGELADALSHYALLNNGEKALITRAREVK